MTTDTEARELVERLTGFTPGPWDAAIERGCHGVIARSLPDGGANFVALVGNDTSTKEREPERFANARLIAAAPDMHRLLTALLAENERLRERLHRIAQPGRTIAYCQNGHEEAVLIARAALKGADDD